MAKSTGNSKIALLRVIEDRELSKMETDEKQRNLVPYLTQDIISNILVRLPFDMLPKLRCVCKPWYSIITSPKFIDAHLKSSEYVLIFLRPLISGIPYNPIAPLQLENQEEFSVEIKYLESTSVPVLRQPVLNPRSKFSIQFMDIEDGKGKIVKYNMSCMGDILASCNGLILLRNKLKEGGLIVLNPVTRELIGLPAGTICPDHKETYALPLSDHTGHYKVVHLFRDELEYIGCEILNLKTRRWNGVNGPSVGLFGWLGNKPVSAIGALHWIPQVDSSDYLVSMEVDREKFHTITLPESSRKYDGILEINSFLGFVVHATEANQINIWVLKGIYGEVWTKHHCITVDHKQDMVPLFCFRFKEEMVFKREKGGSLYSYDFQHHVMRKVGIQNGGFSSLCLPHINSFVFCSSDRKKNTRLIL